METQRLTLAEFVAKHGITMTVRPADLNRNMEDCGADMDNWMCSFRKEGAKAMRVPFSTGTGLRRLGQPVGPSAESVLSCLASDAAGAENAGEFGEWCAEYGYDSDSRKAFRTFRTIERQAEKLRDFLGAEAFEELLWQTEQE